MAFATRGRIWNHLTPMRALTQPRCEGPPFMIRRLLPHSRDPQKCIYPALLPALPRVKWVTRFHRNKFMSATWLAQPYVFSALQGEAQERSRLHYKFSCSLGSEQDILRGRGSHSPCLHTLFSWHGWGRIGLPAAVPVGLVLLRVFKYSRLRQGGSPQKWTKLQHLTQCRFRAKVTLVPKHWDGTQRSQSTISRRQSSKS